MKQLFIKSPCIPATATLLLSLLLVVAVGCHRAAEPPAVIPLPATPLATAPATLGSRALDYVTRLAALGPRDAGTEGAAQAAHWLSAELQRLGLETTIEAFEDKTPDGSATFYNVLATLPGKRPATILLLSHYDTKSGIAPDFIGANDGGSSTGLLLALAEYLATQPPPRHTIQFALLDGEECRYRYGSNDGLHGSRHLAARLAREKAPLAAVILLDMIGDDDLTLTIPRNSSSDLKLLLLDAAAAHGARQRIKLLASEILDDHQPFLDHGFAAIDLIDFEYGSRPGANDYWHTPEDTLDKLSAETLQLVGTITLEMIARLL